MQGPSMVEGWTWLELLSVGGLLLLVLGLLVWVLRLNWEAIQCRRGGWRFVAPFLGWLLILLGSLGGLLPFLPGFPLGILGLILLGPNDPVIRRLWLLLHHRARALADSIYPRWQRVGQRLLRFEVKLARAVYRHGELPPWVEERILQERLAEPSMTQAAGDPSSPAAQEVPPDRPR